eukprot:TRINITY_DN7269_c0_g1_i4.p2 TRINITY_DN7269_c0_g1~~TRINITY_DN7269_c0_g1_i4.p2  ORF type:complete len:250 (+),score=62.34 TRINITY_DN7269_c0_g1_i4:824-1573(+)
MELERELKSYRENEAQGVNKMKILEKELDLQDDYAKTLIKEKERSMLAEIEELKQTIADLRVELAEEQRKNSELLEANTEIKVEMLREEYEGRLKELATRVRAGNSENSEKNSLLDEARTRIKTLEKELSISYKKQATLETELTNLKELNAFLEGINQKMDASQRKVLDENALLQEKYAGILREMEDIRDNTNMKDEFMHQKEKELNQRELEIAALLKENDGLRINNRKLEQMLNTRAGVVKQNVKFHR